MSIPLLFGRSFDQRDTDTAPRVTIISQAARHVFFANQDPVGKSIVVGLPPDGPMPRQIIGVVGDVRDVSLGKAPSPMIYVPYSQATFWGANFVVKTSLAPASVASAIRGEVQVLTRTCR